MNHSNGGVMSRNTDLSSITFPVKLEPLYLKDNRPVPKFFAVVNENNKHIFSVVTKNYKLIPNEQAIELGKKCLQNIFESADINDLEIFNIIAPKTYSFCHVDIIHKDYNINIWAQEAWLPYLRVTNSYNKTRTLRFDLGFCRELCDNGVIFESETMSLQYNHTHNEVQSDNVIITNFHKLKKLEVQFIERMNNLQRFHVPPKYIPALLCKIFHLNIKLDAEDEKDQNFRDHFYHTAFALTNTYFKEFGQNGYAALNVISDFASRPEIYMNPNLYINRYQKLTGNWINTFINEIKKSDFKFENYLGDYAKYAA